MQLDLLRERLAIVRLAPDAAIPPWAWNGPLSSITRTESELSIVCGEEPVPTNVESERAWRALAVRGPLDFALTGVLASLASPLAEAGVSIFALSTYETDYVLVRDSELEQAVVALTAAGHDIDFSGRDPR